MKYNLYNKRIVMIHEITNEVLTKDLSGFDIISFDDGLFTQYLNLEHFLKFNKPLYFFISTGIISNSKQSKEVIHCAEAHKKAFNGNFENYMNWSQIKEIYKTKNCFIGGHSHNHIRLKTISEAVKDTNTMLENFKNQDIKIDSYCFPYNYVSDSLYIVVKSHNFKLFAYNRIAVEDLK